MQSARLAKALDSPRQIHSRSDPSDTACLSTSSVYVGQPSTFMVSSKPNAQLHLGAIQLVWDIQEVWIAGSLWLNSYLHLHSV